MKKSLLLLAATMITSFATAQTDITSQYLQNPSFEADKTSSLSADGTRGAYSITKVTGWTLSGSYGVSDIMTASATATDNNLGKPGSPSDGSQMYYIRNAWANGSAALKQSVKLPAGKYRFAVDSKSATPGTSSSGKIVAGSNNTTITMATGSIPASWSQVVVDFTLTAETTVSVGFEFTWVNSAGASFLLDNCRLYDMSSYVEPEDPTEDEVKSFTEGIINNTFVPEAQMKKDLLQMLANFSKYMVNDFQECQAPNSKNEACGCFKGENTMGNNEQGVRPNADLSMICAFLVKYGKPAGVSLPSGVTWEKIQDMAIKSLVFAYSTHKANKLKVCAGNNYWGSTSTSDAVWESSLWAMSVAYSAFFQWNSLSETQRGYIYNMLKAECNYELYRGIPTGYAGDTKAEENGWEVDVLAVTLGLFPNDPLAPKWFERMREFAINSYSHPGDINNTTVIDPWYDNKTVADLYKGNNLYDDFSLQNHNLFHSSYQNVVMQELGEAALALKMFQMGIHGTEKWKSNALMHNNQQVQDNIHNWLALADGELAMPNGNDWSLFLYDQITSFSTQACFQRDANALMQENMAYKYIQARQKTTTDGSWLLRADVGARRMGVEAHRVMMTFLMHEMMPTADITPVSWDEFNAKHSEAKMLPCQNIVRAATASRFSCFSWSDGLKSYTGYFAANSPDKNKIVVPYRANQTGNITGWYEVSGKATDATPVVKGIYQLDGDGYLMNGEMNVNGGALNNRFAIFSTPGNAIIYLDYVTANSAATITAEKGGLLAISTDELMKTQRTLYFDKDGEMSHKQTDGSTFMTFNSEWVNIDNELGVVSKGNGKKIAFGDRGANNSIYTSKLYPMYSNQNRAVKAGEVVDARNLIYYSLVNSEMTESITRLTTNMKKCLPTGWNGVIAVDPDGMHYMLVSNFKGDANGRIQNVVANGWETTDNSDTFMAPIFWEETTITSQGSSADIKLNQNNSKAELITMMIQGNNLRAKMIAKDKAYVTADEDGTFSIYIVPGNRKQYDRKGISINKGETLQIALVNGKIEITNIRIPKETKIDYTDHIVNPSFQGNSVAGWSGSPAVNYNCAEKFNTTFDVNQTVTGLPKGTYFLLCQGFYRNGGYDAAANARAAGTEKLNAVLYAGSNKKPLMSIMEDAKKNGAIGVNQKTYGYIPNSMEHADSYFRQGLYENILPCKVGSDGTLKIGISKTTTVSSDWTIFDNFRLIKAGDVNRDGKIDVNDAALLVAVVLGNQADNGLTDVNADGNLNTEDIRSESNIILDIND